MNGDFSLTIGISLTYPTPLSVIVRAGEYKGGGVFGKGGALGLSNSYGPCVVDFAVALYFCITSDSDK
jgi:hypothetical protein